MNISTPAAPDLDKKTRAALAAALMRLGITDETLTAAQKASLDDEGYVVIPNAITSAQAAHLARRLEEIAAEEGEDAGKDFHTEVGATRLGSLMNKDPDFDICFLHPAALASVARVMGDDFGLSSLTGRAAQPGEGLQGFHRDQYNAVSANVLWVLSDFTEDNGPTRLIRGSHLWTDQDIERKLPPPEDRMGPHPEQIRIIALAGTLVVINGLTWHGGTKNNTQKNRHLVSAFFTNRQSYQGVDRTLYPHVAQRLDAAAREILDFNEAN